MFDSDSTGPDLCSIRAAAQQAEFPGTARGVLSADGHAFDCSDPVAPVTSSIDRAIRLSTAAAVLAVAGIAAYVSYWHAGLKLIFLSVTRAVSLLCLSRREWRWKDAEILMLCHQLAVG
jgi:hypothetical protein